MRDLQQGVRHLAAATIGLFLAVCVLAISIFIFARGTRAALCTLRGDLVARVDASQTFLISHPDGFAGVSASEIRQDIEGKRRTIASLAGLRCADG